MRTKLGSRIYMHEQAKVINTQKRWSSYGNLVTGAQPTPKNEEACGVGSPSRILKSRIVDLGCDNLGVKAQTKV